MSSRRLWEQSKQVEKGIERSGSYLPPIPESRSHQQGRERRFSDLPTPAHEQSLPTLKRRESLMAYEPVIAKFVRNGDKFFEGVKVNVSKRTVKSWEVLLAELSSRIKLPAGVRNIYTPENGHKVSRLSQLEHHGTYVCGSTEPFKKIDYSCLKNPEWRSPTKVRNADSQIRSVFARTFSIDLGESMQSIKSQLNSSMSGSMSESRLHFKKKPVKLKPLRQPSLSAPDENLELSETMHSSSPDVKSIKKETIRPDKVTLTIFRNGPLPRERVKIDLARDASWEDMKKLISQKFLSINGCLRLFTLSGAPVTSVEELWTADSILIAAGAEKFDISSFLSGEGANEGGSADPQDAPIPANDSVTQDEYETSTPIPKQEPSGVKFTTSGTSLSSNEDNQVTEQPSACETTESGEDKTHHVTVSNQVEIVSNNQVTENHDDEVVSETNKDTSLNNESLSSNQALSGSVSTPPSPHVPFSLRSVSPLDLVSKRPRTLSLVNEMYGDLQAYDRPTSISSNEIDSPLTKQIKLFRSMLPKTPQSDLSLLGGPQSMIDMIMPKLARMMTDSEMSVGSESIDTPPERRRSIGIQTEFVSDHLSTVIDLTQTQVSVSAETAQSGLLKSYRERSRSHRSHSAKHAKDKYNVEMTIHEGRYASVKPCISKDDEQEYFLRAINKAKIFWNDDLVLREVKIMTKLRHENVMTVIDHWETADEICMVMEPVEGSDLYDCIHHCTVFSEADAVRVMHQLGLALVYLHANRIVHRDIRLENIFLTVHGEHDWTLKLGGFSLATFVSEPLCKVCGKQYLRAPEMRELIGYSTKVDVWAAGVICYLLLSGKMPFTRKNQANLFMTVTMEKLFSLTYWSDISEDAKDFIKKLLQPNPQERVSSSEMLQHVWLQNDQPRPGREDKSIQLLKHIHTKAADRIAPVLILSVTALDHQHRAKS